MVKLAVVLLVVVVALPGLAAGEEPMAPNPAQRTFSLRLDPLYLPGYEPARELRLALWDSPMSRLELAAAREQWAFRHVGPTGTVLPLQSVQLPLHLKMAPSAQSIVLGPWSPNWGRLTWQEKIAAGAQTSLIVLTLVQAVRYAR